MSKFTAEYEKEKYTKMHDGRSQGYKAANHGMGLVDTFCQLISPSGGHVIELGAGNGKASEALTHKGLTACSMDIAANALCHNRTIGKVGLTSVVHCAWEPWPTLIRGDWFFTADFFEHLPPERVDDVLKRIKENIKEGGIARICTVPDQGGQKFVGEPLHLTVEEPGWWVSKFTNYFQYVRVMNDAPNMVQIFVRVEGADR